MKLRRWMAAGAAAVSMGAGGLVGALLTTPAISGAQGGEAPAPAGDETKPGRAGRGMHIAPLGEIAEVVGISPQDLRAALQDGQTIAEVAEAHGVDPQTVIDALVAAATDRLEQRLAELPERMGELVNGEFPSRGPGFRHAN